MGLIGRALELIFGSGGNIVRETAEVFRENAEKGAQREAHMKGEALAQFAAEFKVNQRGLFDRIMDAINRIPRPAMALGTIGLFAAAMIDPIWFAERMQGIALVPEPLWWLLGAVVSFYFGARHQLKNQQFQRQVAASLAMTPQVMENLDGLEALRARRSGPRAAPEAAPRTEPELSAARVVSRQVAAPDATRAQNSNHAPVPALPDGSFRENAALRDWVRQTNGG